MYKKAFKNTLKMAADVFSYRRVPKTNKSAIYTNICREHVKSTQKKKITQTAVSNFVPAPLQNWQLPHVVKNVKYTSKHDGIFILVRHFNFCIFTFVQIQFGSLY